ncbi:MAG: hypothetical protein H6R01_942 [Burkholderiaceae bacterium]|nr:hypothetical protein [Burkholderiaceae bacterium]
MTKILSKADIMAANDLKTETVEVPEWGGSVIVRTMTGLDRDQFEASMIKEDVGGKRQPDLTNMRAKLVALTVVDESGDRVFEPSDIDALARKSCEALDRVYRAAQKINGIGASALDGAEKNSEAAQSGDSGSV